MDLTSPVDEPHATEPQEQEPPERCRSSGERKIVRATIAGLADHVVPVVDDDLLLRFRHGWVALTDMQAPIVQLLLANVGRMVSIDEIRHTYETQGGSTRSDALRSLMHRIAKRLIDVGVAVTFDQRRSGMMVTLP